MDTKWKYERDDKEDKKKILEINFKSMIKNYNKLCIVYFSLAIKKRKIFGFAANLFHIYSFERGEKEWKLIYC